MDWIIVYLYNMRNPQLALRGLGSMGDNMPTIQEVLESYEKAYTFTPDQLEEPSTHNHVCSQVFDILNMRHPRDYQNRSLSVGDVIRIRENGKDHYYMVDVLGFMVMET